MTPHWTVSLVGGPRRVNHSAVIVGYRIFMFGGYTKDKNYEHTAPIDVHIFNTYSNRWLKVPDEVIATSDSDKTQLFNIPYMRYGHASVAIGDEAYLWGGRNDSDGACNNLYSFNTNKLRWRLRATKGDKPSARDGHGMTAIRHKIYVFGGYEEQLDCFSNEMYELDTRTYLWQLITHTDGESATARDFHTVTSCGDLIYVFGGRSNHYYFHHSQPDIYDDTLKVFNTRTKAWTEPVNPNSAKPCGRRSHSTFIHNNKLYLFGGYNSVQDKHFNDMWKYDPATCRWNEVSTTGTCPVPRRRQCCCVFNNKLYIFGGTSPSGTKTPTWFLGLGEEEGEGRLYDHDDTHVLDFSPSLKTLCIIEVLKQNIDIQTLPPDVRWEIKCMTWPNSISSPLPKG